VAGGDVTAWWREVVPRFAPAAGALLDFLLPRVCVACEGAMAAGERDVVCGRCWARLRLLPAPRCPRCGHPRPAARECRWCAALPPYVRAVRSVCWASDGPAARIVYALKYHGWTAAAEGMADRMARLAWPRDVVEERAALVPVPLASTRERERGYNQSRLLAVALGARLGVPVWDHVLRRARATTTQTRLTPEERLANVAGAFRAVAAARGALRGRHLVLVDDVVTTVATLNACAAALHAGGARILSFVTFGRARALGDDGRPG
jgi:ComF family protein